MITEKISIFNEKSVDGYFHDYYYRRGNPRDTMRYLTDIKNDFNNISIDLYFESRIKLANVLFPDFFILAKNLGPMTVCGVPRSKREDGYTKAQMGLKQTIRDVVRKCPGLEDGMDFIIRHTDTFCTHLGRSGYGGIGEHPRRGLIKETCNLSPEIKGRNILLVDDIYTPNVNIDEDAIETMFEMGANSVVFYAVGRTAPRNPAAMFGVC